MGLAQLLLIPKIMLIEQKKIYLDITRKKKNMDFREKEIRLLRDSHLLFDVGIVLTFLIK